MHCSWWSAYLKVVLRHGVVDESLHALAEGDFLLNLVSALRLGMVDHESSGLSPVSLEKGKANADQCLVICLRGLRVHNSTIPGQ